MLLPCYVGAAMPGLAKLTPPLPDLDCKLWLIPIRVCATPRACAPSSTSAAMKSHVGPTRSKGRPRQARLNKIGLSCPRALMIGEFPSELIAFHSIQCRVIKTRRRFPLFPTILVTPPR